MRTITLRTFLKEPLKAKRLIKSGQSVQVTDKGVPLWILRPAHAPADEAGRVAETDRVLDEVLRETVPRFSAVRLLEESRR